MIEVSNFNADSNFKKLQNLKMKTKIIFQILIIIQYV